MKLIEQLKLQQRLRRGDVALVVMVEKSTGGAVQVDILETDAQAFSPRMVASSAHRFMANSSQTPGRTLSLDLEAGCASQHLFTIDPNGLLETAYVGSTPGIGLDHGAAVQEAVAKLRSVYP